MTSSPIRVAITGGGLAGASLVHALLAHSHLDVHIFESSPAFKEAGMAIGVARNALDALDLMGPSASQCLQQAGAVPMRGVRFMLAQGEGAGSMIDEAHDNDGQRVVHIVHRAAFLRELLANVPPERMHASKRLDHYVETSHNGVDGFLTIHFTDGTTHECDILIGADGIHSTVRRLLLGEDSPSAFPRNTGAWGIITMRPFAEAQSSIGKDYINKEDAREYSWVGNGTYFMHNVLSEVEMVQMILASHDKNAESPDDWQRTVSADDLKKLYQDWPPHLYKAVNEVRN
ncbi:hypothetical protein EIK77_003608 [Talaromyces pinophilus]|nr:hypothetical protein EIK77_003608 [Talaromyces pinophilus]